MTSNNKSIVKYIALIFVPFFSAILIQYIVSFVDIAILLLKNSLQDKALSADESASSVIKADHDNPWNLAAMSAAQYLIYIIIFGIWYYISFIKENEVKFQKAVTNKVIVFLVIAGVSAQFFTDSILTLARERFPKQFDNYDEMMDKVAGAYSNWLMLLAVFFLAPIGEELLFRGLILRKSKEILPSVYAAILNGLLFGIYHGNVIQGIYAFLFGTLLSFIAMHFDSVLPGMLFHIAVNSSILIVQEKILDSTTKAVTVLIISAVVLSTFMFLIFREKKNDSIQEA